MRILILVFLASISLLDSVYASDDCNSLLSNRLAASIEDLAKLRYDLDSRIAFGESNAVIRGLENAFIRKRKEIVAQSNGLTLAVLNLKLKQHVAALQGARLIQEKNIVELEEKQDSVIGKSRTEILPVGRINRDRENYQLRVLDEDRVLLFGGKDSNGTFLEDVEIYSIASDQFEVIGKLAEPRTRFRHFEMQDGRVLVWTGWNGKSKNTVTAPEIIDPVSKTVEPLGFAVEAPNGFTQISKNEILYYDYMIGWRVLDLTAKKIVREIQAPIPKGGILRILENGDLLVYDEGVVSKVNFDREDLTELGKLEVERWNHAQVSLPENRLLFLGGKDSPDSVNSSFEVFDSTTGQSKVIGNLLQPQVNPSVMVIPDGRVLVFAGKKDKGYVKEVELIDPDTGASELIGEIEDADRVRASVLSNGDVLLVNDIGNLVYRVSVGKR